MEGRLTEQYLRTAEFPLLAFYCQQMYLQPHADFVSVCKPAQVLLQQPRFADGRWHQDYETLRVDMGDGRGFRRVHREVLFCSRQEAQVQAQADAESYFQARAYLKAQARTQRMLDCIGYLLKESDVEFGPGSQAPDLAKLQELEHEIYTH